MRLEDVSRETRELLTRYVDLLIAANEQQNLIARSTVDTIWTRHIADSLQLLAFARHGPWLDIGSGAGLPGLVVAMAQPNMLVLLVEPRARRAEFLTHVVEQLGLGRVSVTQRRAESMPPAAAAVISARAVGPLSDLLAMGARHAAPGCTWLLPKGRTAAEEVAGARAAWQGEFVLHPSMTDPAASIVVARDVRRRAR